jgi:hypothetical protein
MEVNTNINAKQILCYICYAEVGRYIKQNGLQAAATDVGLVLPALPNPEYRAARTQRTSSSNAPIVSSGFDHNDVDEEDNFAAQVDTSSPLDSGLTESQTLVSFA